MRSFKSSLKILTRYKGKICALKIEICINEHAESVIHGKDGKIQNSNSYGNDPCPPKDKK